MAATSEVLQEYLISLGYKMDQVSLGKFNAGISTTGKNVMKVGGAVAGVVASIEASTAAFAYSMRNVYFQSQLANSSIKNLNALGFAGRQIGIGGDAMGQAVQNMSRTIRTNPGMQALIESFGVKVTGRDASDVAIDMLGALKKMPEYVGSQFANQMFGMDADTYHLVISQLDTLKQKKQDALDIYKNMGLDPDKAAEAMLHYAGTMDVLGAKLSGLAKVMMIELAPEFDAMNEMVSGAIDWWADWARGINHISDLFKGLNFTTITELLKEAYGQSDADKKSGKKKSFMEWMMSGPMDGTQTAPVKPKAALPAPGKTPQAAPTPQQAPSPLPPTGAGAGRGSNPVPAATPTSGAAEILAGLEKKYQLPDGLLDKVWSKESNRGKNMRSPVGAKGHFQLMDPTAKELGVNNPDDFKESSNGAARMINRLMRKYEGNLQNALAAYNWGEGNLDKFLKGKKTMPQETQDYVAKITGSEYGKDKTTPGKLEQANAARLGGEGARVVNIENNTTINVTGDNPRETAKEVAKMQTRTWEDATRNLKGSWA